MNKIPNLPNVQPELLDMPTFEKLAPVGDMNHPPRILMLYGSLRERSFSRFLTHEAARILEQFGAEVKIFDPMELPMVGSVPETHPKVVELRELCLWSEGQVWCSPERHGAITGVMKNQIDWIPLEMGAIRPSQGRTLAVMQVCGGSQSFNVVNTLRLLGRWMRMLTIPNQSSVPMAYKEFDDEGRMRPSAYYDRVVDVMEELFKFTLLTRGRTDYLTDRYSERNERAQKAIDRQIQKNLNRAGNPAPPALVSFDTAVSASLAPPRDNDRHAEQGNCRPCPVHRR
jgi:arsenical resistance protein ArsH